MRHTGYHPTGCGATADFGPTKYRYTLMAIKNQRVLKKQKQRDVIQGRRMIQEIHRVLKNNRRKNERNTDMQSRNKQCAIRAITPLAVEQPQTLDLLSTATHCWYQEPKRSQEVKDDGNIITMDEG
jgi:hypothetical protein